MFGIGFDAGSTLGFTDLVKQNPGYSYAIHLNYNYSPFIPISLELQRGKLSGGGDTFALDQNLRKYVNNYTVLILRFDVQLGELLDNDTQAVDLIKNWFVGFGFGGVSDNVKNNRVKPDGSNYVFPGKDYSKEFLASARVGYALKIYNGFDVPAYIITLSYIHNFDIGDRLDGYNDPSTKFKNHDTDHYRQISIGFTYNFGNAKFNSKPKAYHRVLN